jgi:hypothetical protein
MAPNKVIPVQKLSEMISGLGYSWHSPDYYISTDQVIHSPSSTAPNMIIVKSAWKCFGLLFSRKKFPVPFGNDLDFVVCHFDGGLIVYRIYRTW